MREVREETGLLVELTGYIADIDDQHTRRRYYVGRVIGGKPTNVDLDGNTPVEVREVSLDEALELAESEYDRAVLRHLTRNLGDPGSKREKR